MEGEPVVTGSSRIYPMVSLRHNKLWLVLTVAFALVLTGSAAPARALACAAALPETAAAPKAVAPGACESMEGPGPCCCGPEAAADQPAAEDALRSPSGCDCAVQAPAEQQPALKAAVPVPVLDAWNMPAAGPLLTQRERTGFSLVPCRGAPRAPYKSLSLSRGPPAG